jgi:hypothetical protein
MKNFQYYLEMVNRNIINEAEMMKAEEAYDMLLKEIPANASKQQIKNILEDPNLGFYELLFSIVKDPEYTYLCAQNIIKCRWDDEDIKNVIPVREKKTPNEKNVIDDALNILAKSPKYKELHDDLLTQEQIKEAKKRNPRL